MALFKGFKQEEMAMFKPEFMCGVLSEQLALSNEAIKAQGEEIKILKKAIKDFFAANPDKTPKSSKN